MSRTLTLTHQHHYEESLFFNPVITVISIYRYGRQL